MKRFSKAALASFGRRLAGVEVSFSRVTPIFKGRAVIARVFFRDALLHRLHAFEAAARIEIRALFTGVQFKPTFRALPSP